MNDFSIWFFEGVHHILDINGYDHILFVTLLALIYPLGEWKKLLTLVTAFTVGHSITLALSVVKNFTFQQEIIELFIAFTIFSTAVYHLIYLKKEIKTASFYLYFIVLFFGLIHGLGFSFLLKAMLGKEQDVTFPLLYFNLGLELGQLIIITVVVGFSLFLTALSKKLNFYYKLSLVCLTSLIALKMCVERFSELLS